MNPIHHLRKRLGLNQTDLGKAIGCKQANVSHYELGQPLPIERAKRLIAFAKARGISVSYEELYGVTSGEVDEPSKQEPAHG